MIKEKINVKTSRFRDAPWYKEDLSIIIGGVGSIGSWLALFLARQQAILYLYDNDVVEEVNLAGQFYSIKNVGSSKAISIKDNIVLFGGNNNIACLLKYNEDSMVTPIMFSAFDNMEARKIMFENWVTLVGESKEKRESHTIFIDGRLNAEEAEIYVVTPDKIDEYRKTLFNDSEASPQNCSYKSTTHCAAIIAGLMTSAFNNYIANFELNMDYRLVPFSIKYQLPLLNFEIQ